VGKVVKYNPASKRASAELREKRSEKEVEENP
jgi:hypothetical protein